MKRKKVIRVSQTRIITKGKYKGIKMKFGEKTSIIKKGKVEAKVPTTYLTTVRHKKKGFKIMDAL